MITKIVTHHRPHADELVALMMLKNFPEGEQMFPGVSKAKVSFLTTGELPDGKTAKDFPDTIFLGCGGGDFDEHQSTKQERKEGEACASLVAKYLGIENREELKPLIEHIKSEDLQGSKEKDSLSVGIKFLNSCFKDEYELIYKWTEIAYEAHINYFKKTNTSRPFTIGETRKILEEMQSEDLVFWNETIEKAMKYQDDQYKLALDEFRKAHKERFIAADGGAVDLAVVTSDNEEINKAFRSQRMQLIIQFNSRGNVAVFTYQKRGLNLTNSFVLLRMAEQVYRFGEIKIKDKEILSGEGMLEGIPWYLFHTKDCGFNGSLTTKNIPPTMIPHDKVVELVKTGLQSKF